MKEQAIEQQCNVYIAGRAEVSPKEIKNVLRHKLQAEEIPELEMDYLMKQGLAG